MPACARPTQDLSAIRTRPLVGRVPSHRDHDSFTTRFTARFPDAPGGSAVGPVPPGTARRAPRPCRR